jgi:S-adenosylmethionine:tRNA ribosyltransferase-isomerase
VKLSDFDYDLPAEAIAQEPAAEREGARLLVHRLDRGATTHTTVGDLPRWLEPGDLLVVNDTRVRRARFAARRPGGGRTEVLLVEPLAAPPGAWSALVRPAARLRPGMELELPGGGHALALQRGAEPDGSVGATWQLQLRLPAGADPEDWIEAHGSLPLPPYVHREQGATATDAERYQTVYARRVGAVAAPTAGLHLGPAVLAALGERRVDLATVTLHVGPGTFRPVEVEDPRQHRMHGERYWLPAATAEAVARTRARAGRVIAVGTTSARVLETCADGAGGVTPGEGSTELFLLPGTPLRAIDGLFTNFHLPRSTLLLLVAAFAGRERILQLYAEALAHSYRFFSYGDAMLLLRR